MATRTKQIALLPLALMLFASPAKPQGMWAPFMAANPGPPKLTVEDIRKIGNFDWSVRLNLTRNGQPPIIFELNINDAKTKEDVDAKLKPAVNQLATDLQNAAIQQH